MAARGSHTSSPFWPERFPKLLGCSVVHVTKANQATNKQIVHDNHIAHSNPVHRAIGSAGLAQRYAIGWSQRPILPEWTRWAIDVGDQLARLKSMGIGPSSPTTWLGGRAEMFSVTVSVVKWQMGSRGSPTATVLPIEAMGRSR